MFSWQRAVLSMELRKAFAYRVDFWFNFFASTSIFFTISYLLWTSVFDFTGAPTLGGYNREQLIFYFFLVPFFDRVARSNESFFLSHEIYEGGLTRYLLYPVSVLSFKFVGQITQGFIGYLQFWFVFGIYLIFFAVPEGVHITVAHTLMALFALIIANGVNFLMLNLVEMLAFWVDNVWSLSVMVRYFISTFGGYIVPISMFPEWSQGILNILPFGYVIGFPVRTMMGQVKLTEYLQGLGMLFFWLIVFYFLARLVWSRGCKRYTGVGI